MLRRRSGKKQYGKNSRWDAITFHLLVQNSPMLAER
jgi:hypothetical protein